VNRALVLTVDEDRAQTRAIHQRQRTRRTLEGRLAGAARADVLALHRAAQRLIEPITIVNPYAPQLTFVDARTRTRRDHEKYLTLIDVVALLHQHQRERKTITRDGRTLTYLEVTREDIAVANRLAAAVLGRSLDELPPQTRRFLDQLDAWVARECTTQRCHRTDFRFLAREARAVTGLGPTQVKLHLRRLSDLEYVLVHRAPRGQNVCYELVYEAADRPGEATIFSGLREADTLTLSSDLSSDISGYDAPRSASGAERSEAGRPSAGQRPVGGRIEPIIAIVRADTELAGAASVAAGIAVNGTRPRPRRTIVAASDGAP
jgi:hypothetical protein